MHVCYLIDSLIAGGAERSLAALAPGYAELGVRLDVAYFYEKDNVWAGPLADAGATLFSLAGGGRLPGIAARAVQLVRDRRPDVVHTTLVQADIVGRIASLATRVPVVTSLVNEAYGPAQLNNPALRRWKIRTVQTADAVTARRVRRFHAVSTTVATTMAERLHIPLDRIDVIPRGRDARDLGERTDARRARAREALDVAPDERMLLAVGRHEYQKGFDVLLHAVAAARNDGLALRLAIAGREGSDTTQLRELATALHIDDCVDFLGFRTDVPDLLCAADVFVSTSRWEGSPGGVIEAMALEVPIIAADIPAVREVFGDEDCGTVVPPDDVTALARALTPRGDASEARVQRARARFDANYRIDTVTREMVRFYERALAPCNARQSTERTRR